MRDRKLDKQLKDLHSKIFFDIDSIKHLIAQEIESRNLKLSEGVVAIEAIYVTTHIDDEPITVVSGFMVSIKAEPWYTVRQSKLEAEATSGTKTW